MAEAFIYDAVRTPRGRGKPDGSLHEVPTVRLAATTLNAIRERNSLDTHLVDDLILGCVDPIGEAGGDIARAAVFAAGYGAHVPGMPGALPASLCANRTLTAHTILRHANVHAVAGSTIVSRLLFGSESTRIRRARHFISAGLLVNWLSTPGSRPSIKR